GAGMAITPVAFLVVRESGVRMIQLADTSNHVDRAIGMLPEMVDKITALFKKGNPDNTSDIGVSPEV
ncbi:MAG: spore germination protein GerW family protein, partial [Ruthenibacterium sp.]